MNTLKGVFKYYIYLLFLLYFGRMGVYEFIWAVVIKVVKVNRSCMDNGKDGKAILMEHTYSFYLKTSSGASN